jgi:uncharacterized membrane protein YphA (DoxX/SURF4 family)
MAVETKTPYHDIDGNPLPVPVKRYPTMAQSIGLFLARVPLGVLFVYAGVMKFRMGVASFTESSMPAATRFMSENLARMFLNALPYVEIALGALIVLGLLTRVAAFLTTALLISIIISVTKLDPEKYSNFVYTGLAAGLVFCGPGRLSIDGLLFGPRRTVTVTEKYTEPLP